MKVREFIKELKEVATDGNYKDWGQCEIGFLNKAETHEIEFLHIIAEADNYIDVVLNIGDELMPTKTAEKTLEKITYKSSNQSISYRELYNYKNLKIKIEIKSDSYSCQCYARASVLDGLEWRVIYTIPYAEMHTRDSIIYLPNYRNDEKAAEREFKSDVEQLKKYVRELL